MHRKILIADDTFSQALIDALLNAGHTVVFAQEYQHFEEVEGRRTWACRLASGEQVSHECEVMSWVAVEALSDDLLATFDAILMDGNLKGWRRPGAAADLKGVELVRYLRARNYGGKIFGCSVDDVANREMIRAGATDAINLHNPVASLDRHFPDANPHP